jgi:7-carboxy-7-deazaguanine synthase
MYSVKEIFYTLQGEGANAGRAAVFCRFTGCNLWTGREVDRLKAVCNFCDTDFIGTDGSGGGKFDRPEELACSVASRWPRSSEGVTLACPLVVCTGGEPLLQLDAPAVEAFHQLGFEVAVETNGTVLPPPGIDWVCVSPKGGAELRLRRGDELKVVFPQPGADPACFEDLAFQHYYIQPMDGPELAQNTRLAVEYCLRRPRWRLSLQTHKLLGIP